MSKTIEFENRLHDLVTETFNTREELEEAIEYFGESKISSLLRDNLEYY